jgi:hypothetical protein
MEIDLELWNNNWIYFNTNEYEYLRALSNYFSYYTDNYMWSPKYKSGQWDGKINLYFNKKLPFGLLTHIIKFHTKYFKEYKLNISNEIQKK